MLNSRKKQISRYAEKLRERHSLKSGFDIYALMEKEGFIFRKKNLEAGMSGALLIDGDLKIITVNRSDSENRKRFTIAHEMGHFYLHDGFSVSVSTEAKEYYRDLKASTGEHIKEVEANYFAACLLMPEDEILDEVIGETTNDKFIQTLAEKFKVSEIAMAIRLSSLGYV